MREQKATSPKSRVKLTRRVVDSAISSFQRGRRERHWDADLKEFYLQITPNGVASYCLRFNKPDGGKGDYTIGRAKIITPEAAREHARLKLAGLALSGTNPTHQRKAQRAKLASAKANTFDFLSLEFQKAKEAEGVSAKTLKTRRWLLDRYILPSIGHKAPQDVAIRDVKQIVRAVKAGIADTRNCWPSSTARCSRDCVSEPDIKLCAPRYNLRSQQRRMPSAQLREPLTYLRLTVAEVVRNIHNFLTLYRLRQSDFKQQKSFLAVWPHHAKELGNGMLGMQRQV